MHDGHADYTSMPIFVNVEDEEHCDEITDEAEFQLVFDEIVGDMMKSRGNGNILMNPIIAIKLALKNILSCL